MTFEGNPGSPNTVRITKNHGSMSLLTLAPPIVARSMKVVLTSAEPKPNMLDSTVLSSIEAFGCRIPSESLLP